MYDVLFASSRKLLLRPMLEVYCSVFRIRSQLWAFRTAYLGQRSKAMSREGHSLAAENIEETENNPLEESEGYISLTDIHNYRNNTQVSNLI